MKAVTVRQPWAWAIMHAGKDVENRTRNIAGTYRGPLIIHAAKGYDEEDFPGFLNALLHLGVARPRGEDLHLGSALGIVDLVDVHDALTCQDAIPVNALESEWVTCSPWGEFDVQHLVMANPRPFADPIPYRGQLGLWEFPDDLLPEEFR